MKTPIAVLGFAAAALCAGSALAQNAPRGPAPRGGNTPPPAVRSVPPSSPPARRGEQAWAPARLTGLRVSRRAKCSTEGDGLGHGRIQTPLGRPIRARFGAIRTS